MPRHICRPDWCPEQRLAYYSVRDPENGCVLWTGGRTRDGYGRLWIKGRPLFAHRVAWEAKNGPIPTGLNVCHRCDVRTCINPNHMFLGTQKENMADRSAKLRRKLGIEEGPERRPSKAPEIIRFQILGQEFVTRVLEVRPCEFGRHVP
jgi:hypothetical protein